MRSGRPAPTYLPDRPEPSDWPEARPHRLSIPPEDGMDLFRKLWRRKMLILVAAGVGGVIASLASATLTPRYSAETRVLIGVDLPNVTDIPTLLQETAADQEVMQSESLVLTSRGIGQRVADRLALDQDPEFNPALREKPAWRRVLDDAKARLRDAAKGMLRAVGVLGPAVPASPPTEAERRRRQEEIVVSQLLSRLDVVPIQRSHVLSVNAESESPGTAARIADAVARTYIEQQLSRRAEAAETANAWLQQRIAALRERVENAERATEAYRREHGLYETRNDKVVAQRLAELNTQLVIAESERASAEARLAQAERAEREGLPADDLPEVVNSPLIQSLLQRRVETEREAAHLASTYGPQHPQMRDIGSQLADIRGAVAAEVAKVVQSLRHEVEATRSRVETLRANLTRLEGELGQDNAEAIRLNELEREAEASRQLLVSFLERANEAEVQPNIGEPSAVVISEAALPLSPSFPPTTMLRLLGVIGGVLVGMVIALLREHLDRTFRTIRQVEEVTNLPVIGVVPSAGRPLLGRRSALEEAESPFGLAIGSLLEQLAFMAEARGRPGGPARNVLTLTSATPGEGKSRIAVALLRLVAHRGHKVIILDCDWRRPTVNRHFSHPASPGLVDLLAGEATPDEVVYRDPDTGGHAIFAGNLSLLPSEVERLERLKLLQTTLARHYDLVIVDTPPVLAGPEAIALARMAGEVAFVVRWGRVPRDVVVGALRSLAFAGTRLGGVVLSDVDPRQYRRYGMGDVVYPYSTEPVTRAA